MSLGAAGDVVARHVAGGRGGIERMTVVDSSQRMLQRCRDAATDAANDAWPRVRWYAVLLPGERPYTHAHYTYMTHTVQPSMICIMPCSPQPQVHASQLEYLHAPPGQLPLDPASVDRTYTAL